MMDLDRFVSDVVKVGVETIIGSLSWLDVSVKLNAFNTENAFTIIDEYRVKLDSSVSDPMDIMAYISLNSSGITPVYTMLCVVVESLSDVLKLSGMADHAAKDLAKSLVVSFYHLSDFKFNKLFKDSEITYIDRFIKVLSSCGLFNETSCPELTDEVLKLFGRSLLKGELDDQEN